MAGISRQQVQERFDRLTEILGDMVTQADAQAATRCPYRDRHDLCTAKFRCRNQALLEGADMACSHDGTFDFRSAWETDPRAASQARDKIHANRRHAADGRD